MKIILYILIIVIAVMAFVYLRQRPFVPSVQKPVNGTVYIEGVHTIVVDYGDMKLVDTQMNPGSLTLYSDKTAPSILVTMKADRTIWAYSVKDGRAIDEKLVGHRDEIDRVMYELANGPGYERILSSWYPTNFSRIIKSF